MLLILSAAFFTGAGCIQQKTPVEIEFIATWNGKPIGCQSEGMRLTDLRMYVSDVAVIDADGSRNPVTLVDDGAWQQDKVAMVDLEDGEGACQNGSAVTHSTIKGESAASSISGLEMTIGVPLKLNHANPLTAPAPLDDSAMHWHWRSGYKFLRAGIEFVVEGSVTDRFWLHLGSTGCEGTVQNITGCNSPNRIHVAVDNLTSRNPVIEIDLSALFDGVNFTDGERGDCSSGPAETACIEPFVALGLPHQGTDSGLQRVFKAARQTRK